MLLRLFARQAQRRTAARKHARAPRLTTLLWAGTLAGCASSSIHSDVSRVRELTRAPALPNIGDNRVETRRAEQDPEIQKLLAQPLDADSAVRIGLLANRELRARMRELGVTRGRVLQAGLWPNPRGELEVLPERATELELRLEYDITRAILAPLRLRAYGPELEAARYRVAAAVIDFSYRVREGFLRVQAAEQRVELARQSLLGLASARDAARAMFEAGNAPALDLATEETAYEQGEIEVERLLLDNTLERESFARLLGIPARAPHWQLRQQLPAAPERALSPDALEERALRASLDLRGARQELESLARRAGFTRTEGIIPDISADVHALSGHPDGGNARDDVRFGGGVNVSIPLFDRQQGNALALESSFRAQLERYYGLLGDLRSEARALQERANSAHRRARRYQEVILPNQTRVTEQTLLQYNAMQIGVFQLLAARREQLSGQLAYIEVLREYWSSVAEIEALLQGRRAAISGSTPSPIANLANASSSGGHD